MPKDNEYFLREALKEACKAEAKGEVPVGAVITLGDRIVGRGHNRNITLRDPTAHAEIIALRKAAKKLNNYRLPDCKIFVTVEPCPMCAGALIWARVSEIVFGAYDPKAGACGSVIDIPSERRFNHRIQVTGGLLEHDCRTLLQQFFKRKRKQCGS